MGPASPQPGRQSARKPPGARVVRGRGRLPGAAANLAVVSRCVFDGAGYSIPRCVGTAVCRKRTQHADLRDAIAGDGGIAITSRVIDAARTGPAGDGTRTLRLRVSDTGSGMDATTKARVFEPFFTTKDQAHGTGLGLYTAFMLAQQASGSIQLDSEPGAGTTVTVDLPIRSEWRPRARGFPSPQE